jgi:hypothetical protein
VSIDSSINVTIFGTQGLVSEARHVHDKRIIRSCRAVLFRGPVGNSKLGIVQKIRIARNDLFPTDLKLAILGVIESSVDGAAGNGTSCVQYTVDISECTSKK